MAPSSILLPSLPPFLFLKNFLGARRRTHYNLSFGPSSTEAANDEHSEAGVAAPRKGGGWGFCSDGAPLCWLTKVSASGVRWHRPRRKSCTAVSSTIDEGTEAQRGSRAAQRPPARRGQSEDTHARGAWLSACAAHLLHKPEHPGCTQAPLQGAGGGDTNPSPGRGRAAPLDFGVILSSSGL